MRLTTRARAAVAGALAALPLLGLDPASARAENAYVPEAGTVWVKAGYGHWRADDRFAGPFKNNVDINAGFEPGDVAPLKTDLPESRLRVDHLDVELRMVPIDRVFVRLNLPYYQRMRFEQTGAVLENQGPGDLRTFVGYLLTNPGSRVLTQIRVHAKIPTRRAQFEDATVPLSEGQLDVGPELLTTWRIADKLWLSGSLLYRHRFEVEADNARLKPGNETAWAVRLEGEPLATVWLSAMLEGLVGQAWQDRTFMDRARINALDQRELHSVLSGVYWEVGALVHRAVRTLALDLQVRYPFAGRDWPRGPQIFAGIAYSTRWGGTE